MRKKWMVCFLVGLASQSFAQFGSLESQQPNPQTPSNQNQYNQSSQNPTGDCQHLSVQEQNFASQLSPVHRTMFCRHFSVAQRIEAMTLAQTPVQSQGQTISPDEAVEIVMKSARTTPTPNGNSNGQDSQSDGYRQRYGQSNGNGSSYPQSNRQSNRYNQ